MGEPIKIRVGVDDHTFNALNGLQFTVSKLHGRRLRSPLAFVIEQRVIPKEEPLEVWRPNAFIYVQRFTGHPRGSVHTRILLYRLARIVRANRWLSQRRLHGPGKEWWGERPASLVAIIYALRELIEDMGSLREVKRWLERMKSPRRRVRAQL